MQSGKQAKRLKSLLGADSQEWAAVKQGMWNKLTTESGAGPQRLQTTIRKFLTGEDHRLLAAEMFTTEERRQMMLFANTIKRLVPPEGTVYHSNTPIGVAMIAKDGFKAAATLAGAAAGATGGPVAGAAAYKGTSGIMDMLVNRAGIARAKAVAAGIAPRRPTQPSIIPGIIAAREVEVELRGPR